MEGIEELRNSVTGEAARASEATIKRRALAGERARAWLYFGVGAVVIGLVFWWLQFSTRAVCCGDYDGYYHIRWSQLLWEGIKRGQFPPAFTWLPLTTLNAQDYVDHHLLFHLLQIPFTWFGDIRLGAKVSAALFASLAVLSCFWLILRHRISYPFIWLFALLGCSAPFLYRMNMAKAMSVSIVLLVIGIQLLFTRRSVWLLPLAFVFTLTYDMFVLLAGAAALWTAVRLWSERRFEWQPLTWTLAGVAAGLVINPYFPENVQLLVSHALMKVRATDYSVAVGNEWYPYESWDFFRNCFIAFAAMFAGYVAFRWDGRERDETQRALFFLIFSTGLLIVNARWRRFAEYWPPFAVLFAAFSLQLLFISARAKFNELPADVLDDLQPFLDQHERAETAEGTKQQELWRIGVASFVGLLLAISMIFTIRHEAREIAESAPPEEYRAAAEWLRQNVPPGEMIFNTDWDDFPKLFYYDPTHAYVTGLDPTYLYDRDRELSKLYEDITLGREKNPGPPIRERFGARYVFTDNAEVHNDFYENAMNSGWFEEVYTDKDTTILFIRDRQAATPPAEDEETTEQEAAPDPNSSQ
ncbi:hypothetical protein BH18ACI2_BH18ACI2_03200 [soil metagenome]